MAGKRASLNLQRATFWTFGNRNTKALNPSLDFLNTICERNK